MTVLFTLVYYISGMNDCEDEPQKMKNKEDQNSRLTSSQKAIHPHSDTVLFLSLDEPI